MVYFLVRTEKIPTEAGSNSKVSQFYNFLITFLTRHAPSYTFVLIDQSKLQSKLKIIIVGVLKAVLRIRIRIRIHMFLGLLDPDPDPLVRGMDPDPALDPDPSLIMQK